MVMTKVNAKVKEKISFCESRSKCECESERSYSFLL